MQLVEVIEDATMLVRGYEHQTWRCSSCGDVEQRMKFRRADARLECADQERPCAEDNSQADRQDAYVSAWRQAVRKLSNTQVAARQRESLAGKISQGVGRLEEFLGNIKQRYCRGVPMVNKRAATAAARRAALQSSAKKGKDVQEPSADIKTFDQLWETDPTQNGLGPCKATIEPIINKDAVLEATTAAPPSGAIRGDVISKTVEDLQNFDQLWESLVPSRD